MEIRATIRSEGDSTRVKAIIDYMTNLENVELESIEAR